MRGWGSSMFLVIVSERFVLSFSHRLQNFFFSVYFVVRWSFVIILHEQSPGALLRLSLETSRCLKRAFVAIERLEVEEKLAVAEEGMSVFSNESLQRGGKNLRILACLAILLSLLRVLVEQARITDTALDRRHVGSVNVFLGQTLPSDFGEPRVVHDIATATVQVAKTFGQIVCDEFREQVLGVRVDVRRVLDSAFEDVLVNLQWRASIPEGCESAQHFEDENTE